MSDKKKYENFQYDNPIDWDSVVKDILRHWWVILLLTISAVLLAGTYKRITYRPVYEATTTFVVGKSGFTNHLAYDNLNSATSVTTKFTQIIKSSVLKNRVCEELDLSSFRADVKIDVIESSNIMTLSLTASSPGLAYRMIHSVMDSTIELSGELMDKVTLKVLQAPVMPQEPKNPLFLLGAMIKFGILMFVLIVSFYAVRSYFKDTVKNAEEAKRKIDTKLLGIIYHEKKIGGWKRLLKKSKKGLIIEDSLVSFSYVESVKMISTKIHSSMNSKGTKVLMITSVSENEGKSTVAANVALALAQEDKKVALIDCDFCKPSQYKLFEVKNSMDADFVDYLKGTQPLTAHTAGENGLVQVLCSKKAKQHFLSQEIITKLRETIKTLSKDVDYIILDTSPMALVSDGEDIAALADASILVVQQDHMEAKYINDTIDQLNRTNAKVIGCIFNNVHKGIFVQSKVNGYYGGQYKYSYKYGKYGRYGYGKK